MPMPAVLDRHPKPPYPTKQPRPVKSRAAKMTMCLAAKSQEIVNPESGQQLIILCADRRIENDTAGSETGFKIEQIHNCWVALIAGNLSEGRILANRYRTYLKDESLTVENYADVLAIPARMELVRRIDMFTVSQHGMTRSEFLKNGSNLLGPAVFEATEAKITNVGLECELLLVGFADLELADEEAWPRRRAVICSVDKWGQVAIHDHFKAIGSGAVIAETMLHYRGHTSAMPFMRGLYHVYEAKKFAECAPGVGRTITDLAFLDDVGVCRFMSDDGLAFLESLRQICCPAPTEDLAEERLQPNFIETWTDRQNKS